MIICHDQLYPEEMPDAGLGLCCMGAAMYGPDRCTCWEPVYDLEQQPPDRDALTPIQQEMCPDCAYRPGSPERQDEHDADDLRRYTYPGPAMFFCHQGMRRPVKWVHPAGVEVAGDPADYRPPRDPESDRPYRADGQPAFLCAGWLARRLLALKETWPDLEAG